MKPDVSAMAKFITYRTGFRGGTAVILGSGLGSFADQLADPVVLPYGDIPDYPRSTVAGHSGELVAGNLRGNPLIVAKGRFHFYEGYDYHTVTLPIRLFRELGVSNLIITNAAGSMKPETPPGNLMLIKGHMDCTFRHGVELPRRFTGHPYHNPGLLKLAKTAAGRAAVPLGEGIYCWVFGPAYETPAEISFFRELGGDAVGMSTVPEILSAAECGIPTLAISTLTNYAAGISDKPLTHEEVLETANRVKSSFIRLLTEIVVLINAGEDSQTGKRDLLKRDS